MYLQLGCTHTFSLYMKTICNWTEPYCISSELTSWTTCRTENKGEVVAPSCPPLTAQENLDRSVGQNAYIRLTDAEVRKRSRKNDGEARQMALNPCATAQGFSKGKQKIIDQSLNVCILHDFKASLCLSLFFYALG